MTRSLGDLEAHRDTGLIADPELQEYQASRARNAIKMGLRRAHGH